MDTLVYSKTCNTRTPNYTVKPVMCGQLTVQ